MPDTNGGPAFPMAFPAVPGLECQYGMDLRDYFAAHAPVEPQPWFRPVLPERPTLPDVPECEGGWSREMVERVIQWRYDDGGADLIAFMPQRTQDDPKAVALCNAYQSSYTGAKAALYAHNKECDKQRLVQWPYAWADAMLAQRERKGAE